MRKSVLFYVLLSSAASLSVCHPDSSQTSSALRSYLNMMVGGHRYEALQEEGSDLMRALQVKALAEEETEESRKQLSSGMASYLFQWFKKKKLGCWSQALTEIESACSTASSSVRLEEEMSKLAMAFTNCHLRESGLKEHPCKGKPTQQCTKKMNDKTFNAYTNFRINVFTICWSLEKENYDEYVSVMIENLLDASVETLAQTSRLQMSLTEVQEEIGQQYIRMQQMAEQTEELHTDLAVRLANVSTTVDLGASKAKNFFDDLLQHQERVMSVQERVMDKLGSVNDIASKVDSIYRQSMSLYAWGSKKASWVNWMDLLAYSGFISFTIAMIPLKPKLIVLCCTCLHATAERMVFRYLGKYTPWDLASEETRFYTWLERLFALGLIFTLAFYLTGPSSSSVAGAAAAKGSCSLVVLHELECRIASLSIEVFKLRAILTEANQMLIQHKHPPSFAFIETTEREESSQQRRNVQSKKPRRRRSTRSTTQRK